MLLAMIASAVLVFSVVLIHYELLRAVSAWLPHIALPPRPRILVVIAVAFAAHTIEVWLYAMAYYLLSDHFGIGHFGGQFQGDFSEYLYFSTVTYTTVGFGDVYPLGALRLMAGVESLVGLLMIAWSASFTYLAMERFWDLHGPRA